MTLCSDIHQMIQDYQKDVALVELYDKFYARYADRFNLKKAPHMPDIEGTLADLPNRVITLDDDMWEDGGRLDNMLMKDSDEDNPTRIYSQQNAYQFPRDFISFYSIFQLSPFNRKHEPCDPKQPCDSFHGVCKKHAWTFLPLNELTGCEEMFHVPHVDEENPHYAKPIYYKDWVTIFRDVRSVDNAYGSLYTNLNPKAAEFGQIYAYSSNDDGTLSYIASSFREFIQLVLDKDHLCKSLCDQFNFEWCDCDLLAKRKTGK